jgi:hypothetical protein
MDIKNFSDFLLEKEGVEVWKKTDGDWFLEYISSVTGEKVKLSKKDIIKTAEDIDKIDTTQEAEKLFQFAKYCIDRPEKSIRSDYKDKEEGEGKNKKKTPGLLSKIKDEKVNNKSIEKILSGGIEKTKMAQIKSIYDKLKEILGLKNALEVVEKLSDFAIPKGSTADDNIWKIEKEKKSELLDTELRYNNIPLNPTKTKLILTQAELCIRYSLRAIKGINTISSPNTEEVKNKVEKEIKNMEEKDTGWLSKIEDKNKKFFGESDKKEGLAWSFYDKYTTENSDKKSLIYDDKNRGLRGVDITEYLELFKKAKESVISVKKMVDDDKMTSDEWFKNVQSYKPSGGYSVGEGLKSAMFKEVKEGIGYLQDSIDNYCAGDGGKNALDQYIEAFKETVNRAKEKAQEVLE